MKKQQYRAIIYFIGIVVASTLATQVYWNYKNYQEGKAQLIRDVQTSLNESVDHYYVNETADNIVSYTLLESKKSKTTLDSLANNFLLPDKGAHLDSLPISEMSAISIFRGTDLKNIDSLNKEVHLSNLKRQDAFKFLKGYTSNANKNMVELTSKVFFSMTEVNLNLAKMDSLIGQGLKQKKLPIDYAITYTDASKEVFTTDNAFISKGTLQTIATSDYMHKNTSLVLSFTNETKTILKRNLAGIILSCLLVGAVLTSLLYLLKIIQEQKQLAQIKNDFISNITHEFKTPIATIGAAMESIQHFNEENNPEKTKKYVDMSSQQVSKLNIMVEKLLETATLDSQALELNKQDTNLYDLLEGVSKKYNSTQEKRISLNSGSDMIWLSVDSFHMENAIDNIVDNAIKYGGDYIDIACSKTKNGIQIAISDNGNTLLKSQTSQVFEKFYRVPKGNTHNVKGFGIGLYYTKTIIEKHNGSITVSTNPTRFTILLPYV